MAKNAYGQDTAGDSFRKQWDAAAYAQKAHDREQQQQLDEANEERRHKGLKPRTAAPKPAPPRDLLEARKTSVNLDKMVGTSQIVQASAAAAGQPGFYCKDCDVTVKDSLSFLDHINGKKHQRLLNRKMQVPTETLDDVLKKLDQMRADLRRRERQSGTEYDFYAQVRKQQQLDIEARIRRRDAKKKSKLKRADAKNALDRASGVPDEMAAMMGFSSFGSSKQ
ncbi:U4/U6.U5 snRNP associated protein [Coemansia sp. RSA 2708]|nr:U4/U6.U5 snRNP associated protein [Coemansia sp. RSA 2708]KAJ2304758.1 U4/U6.U5 snRNP associated protein [Coemansia sp. RSA 2705]